MKFGIDLGGSHVAIGLVDENSEIIEKRTYYMNDRRNVSLEDYIVSSIVHGIKYYRVQDITYVRLRVLELQHLEIPKMAILKML